MNTIAPPVPRFVPGVHPSQRSDREKYLIACIEYHRARALRAEARMGELEAAYDALHDRCERLAQDARETYADRNRLEREREQAAELEMGVWPQ